MKLLVDILLDVAVPLIATLAMVGYYEWDYVKKRKMTHQVHLIEMRRLRQKHARVNLIILLYKLGITKSTRKLL